MARTRRVVLVVFALALLGCAAPPSDDPELILTGGVIYPLGGSDASVSSLAIRGDAILAIGSLDDVSPLAGDYTQQMRLDGAVVLPGAYDAWIDLEGLGRWTSSSLDMRLASSLDEAQAMVRNAAGDGAPDDEWLIGWGWDENDWPTPALPDAAAIDALDVRRPVALLHRNGRVAWVNQRARAALPGTPGDGIVRGAAMASLRGLIGGSTEERAAWLADGGRHAASAGITRAGSAPTDGEAVEALLELEFRGLLPLRVDVRLTPDAAMAFAAQEPPARLATSELVRIAGVAVQLDGPLASRLAALSAPYAVDAPSAVPFDEELSAAVQAADALGLPLIVQASGDAATTAAVSAIAGAAAGGELVGGDLLPEGFDGFDGLTVSMAAARFSRDVYWLDRVLGVPRAARAHAWHDLFAGGATLRFASDAPAGFLRPMAAVAAAAARQDPEGYPAGGWNVTQALPQAILVRALVGTGSGLAAGDPADLVVWSEDPVIGDAAALRRAEALLTVVAGRVAYSRALVDPNSPSEGR